MRHYVYSNFSNLFPYLSSGIIFSPEIGMTTQQYYINTITGNQSYLYLYNENNLPKPNDENIVALEFTNLSKKIDSKFSIAWEIDKKGKLKKRTSISNNKSYLIKNSIPISFLDSIIFPNQELYEKFNRMTFSNLFETDFVKLKIDKNLFNGFGSKLDYGGFNFDNENILSEKNYFKESAELLTLLNYFEDNAIFPLKSRLSIPNDFETVKIPEKQNENFLNSIFNIVIGLKNKKEIPSEISEDTRLLFFYLVLRFIQNKESIYEVQQKREDYIDNQKKFEFKNNELINLGKAIAEECKNNINLEKELEFIRKIFKSQLDLTFNSLIKEAEVNFDLSTSQIIIQLLNLLRYGYDKNKILSKYLELVNKNDINLLPASILLASYIGIINVPSEKKKILNFEYYFGLLNNEFFGINQPIFIKDSKWKKPKLKWPLNSSIKDDVIKLANGEYKIIPELCSIKDVDNSNFIENKFIIKNKYGYKFSVKIRKKFICDTNSKSDIQKLFKKFFTVLKLSDLKKYAKILIDNLPLEHKFDLTDEFELRIEK